MADVDSEIVELWSELSPVAGYTSGQLTELTSLFLATAEMVEAVRERIERLTERVGELADVNLRTTAAALLTSLRTQLDLARPSGAGPSGTGMGGVYAAADGVFYIVLKQDHSASWLPQYLDAVLATVEFETKRWWGQEFTVLVRRECLDTVTYMEGTLSSLVKVRADVQPQCDAIRAALAAYREMFLVPGLDSNDFATYWPVFQGGTGSTGPSRLAVTRHASGATTS